MSELFGTPSGFRAYDEDQAKLSQLGAQTQLLQAQTSHQASLSKLNEAQAGAITRKAQQDEEEQRMIRAALSGAATNGVGTAGEADDNPIGARLNDLARLGNAMITGGRVQTGIKMLEGAAKVSGQLASADAQRALELRRQTQTQATKLNFIREVLSDVNSPQTYQAAVMALQGNPLTADDELPDALKTYNQPAINALVAGTRAMHEKVMERLRGSEVASANSARDANIVQQKLRTDILQQRADAYVAGKERGSKVGADRAVPPPSKTERADTQRVLKDMGFDVSADERDLLTQDISEQAKLLATRNPALTYAEARAQVIKDAVSRGELKKVDGFLSYVPFGAKAEFKLGDATPTRPSALPSSPDKLKVGGYYRGKDGTIRRYTGKSFEVVLKGGQVPSFATAGGGEDDNEE